MKPLRLLVVALVLCANAVGAAEPPLQSIGVARADITPNYPVRLHGYGNRRTNSQGVAQPLFAKALAFGSDRQNPRILFTVDNLGVPGAVLEEVAARLKKRAAIAREDVALCSSHTHSAPMLSGVAPNIFSSDLVPEQQGTVVRYTRELTDQLEALAMAALSNRAPSRLAWTEGTVKFAKNRRVIRNGRAQFGENEAAPVDHTLAVMIVRGADGGVRAVLANYACHCTTMGGEFNQVHGDWSGCAQETIEREYPGVIALISIGCGADANPSPRGKVENARAHGEEIAAEVGRLLKLTAKPLTELPDTKLKLFDLDFDPLPTRAQWEARAKQPGIVGYHAKKNLARLDRGEKLPTTLPYSVQTWTFGDELAMVFLPGEVVIDYQRRLKQELDGGRLWVNAYANDVPCYIPSRRILTEGGYEAEDSLWYYDRPARLAMSTEDRIVNAVHDLLPKTFAKPKRAALSPLPPAAALKSMRAAPGLTVDLVASEPLVIDPVAIDWGADGRLWVAEMRDYPMGVDGNWQPGGVVKFLEDTDQDGRYDRATRFLEGVPFPTGVFAWRAGVLVCAAPDILYAEDTDGDGRADVVRKVFTGFATNNYQARVNSLSLGLDNWIHGANGLLGGKISFAGGAGFESRNPDDASRHSPLRGEIDIRGRDFRMDPDTGAFETTSGLTQQGRVRDDFGNWFGCDNSHLIWHYPLADEYVRRNPHVAAPGAAVVVTKGSEGNRLFPASETLERFNEAAHANRVTSACGLEIYRDSLLGPEFYRNAFTCEPVHNLVHREVISANGVTFRSARATNEQDREFLASTDNWFRPVQARTGPDGALWVVDMYREVIEHPRWIPSNRLAQLNVRAGEDKGRIYRVYPTGTLPRSVRNLAKLGTPDLAAAMDSPNGTVRDMVHRELLNRADKAAVPTLTRLVSNHGSPAVRAQSLAALQGLGGMKAESFETALRDKDERVRELAMCAAPSPTFHSMVLNSIEKQSANAGERLRFQSALSLGGMSESRATEALERFLAEATTNSWMRAAIASGANGRSVTLLTAALRLPDGQGREALVQSLVATAVAEGKIRDVALMVVPSSRRDAVIWRLRAMQTLLEATSLESGIVDSFKPGLRELCRDIVADPSEPQPVRTEALSLFASMLATAADEDFLRGTFAPGPLQGTAVKAVLRNREEFIGETLLRSWSLLTPGQRQTSIHVLVTRPAWASSLLAAVEKGTVAASEIPLAVRSRLMDHGTVTRERAEKIWQPRPPDRNKLIAGYLQAVSSGNAERGQMVYDAACASCHVLNGRGQAVGPDLAPLRDKSVEDFLVAILDPNAAVEPRYVSYTIECRNGATYSGVIQSESATGLQVVAPGIREVVLRSDILRIQASSLSLMPEGLEQGIAPEQMRDLIAFLRSPAR